MQASDSLQETYFGVKRILGLETSEIELMKDGLCRAGQKSCQKYASPTPADQKARHVDQNKQLVLTTCHPDPLGWVVAISRISVSGAA